MLPRVLDPCKRHSSKERAKLRRYAAMLTVPPGMEARVFRLWLTISADCGWGTLRLHQVACVAPQLAAILSQPLESHLEGT